MATDQHTTAFNRPHGSITQGEVDSNLEAAPHTNLKVLYTAQVRVQGGREGHARSDDGALAVHLSKPPALGGKKQADTKGEIGTNPEQLFAAGYAACFLSALEFVAQQENDVLPKDAAIHSTVDLGKADDAFGLAVTLKIILPNVDRNKANKWKEKAHQICPYSNATRNNINVTLTLV